MLAQKPRVVFLVGVWLLLGQAAFAQPQRLTLEDCERLALQGNLSVIAAQKAVAAAEAAAGVSRAPSLPNVAAEAAYVRLGPEVVFQIPTPTGTEEVTVVRSESKTFTAKLSQLLYSSGQVEYGIKAADRGLEAARATLEDTLDAVLLDTRKAFYNVLRAEELRAVAEQRVAQASEHLRVAKARLEAEVVPQVEVMRAEVELADAQYSASQAARAERLAVLALLNVMSAPPEQALELIAEGEPESSAVSLEECLAWSLKRRNDIFALRRQVESVEAASRAAAGAAGPSLALNAQSQWQPATAFSSDNTWSVAIGLSVPVFDGSLARNRARQLRGQAEELMARLEQLEQGVDLQVRSAYLSMRTTEQELAAAKQARSQAEEVMRISDLRYEAGVAVAYEVIDAQTALTAAGANYANALYDLKIAQAELARAVSAYSLADLTKAEAEE